MKKIISLLTITAMLIPTAAAFADTPNLPSDPAANALTSTPPALTEEEQKANPVPQELVPPTQQPDTEMVYNAVTPAPVVTDAQATTAPDPASTAIPAATLVPAITPAPVSNVPSYIASTVTVTAIDEEKIETVLEGQDKEKQENIVNFTILDTTAVFGKANGDKKTLKDDVKVGDTITVYSNAYAPAPLVLPPVYQADVIMVNDNKELDSERFADADTYITEDSMLVNAANTLALNLDDTVEIVDTEGNKADQKDLDKKDLLVIYSITTRSIPAQTTPIKVVVLGENELALAQIEASKAAVPTTAPITAPKTLEVKGGENIEISVDGVPVVFTDAKPFIDENSRTLVPVRALSEMLNADVQWDDATKTVTIQQNGKIVTIVIGSETIMVDGNAVQMDTKAIISESRTYIPIRFAAEALGLTVTWAE